MHNQPLIQLVDLNAKNNGVGLKQSHRRRLRSANAVTCLKALSWICTYSVLKHTAQALSWLSRGIGEQGQTEVCGQHLALKTNNHVSLATVFECDSRLCSIQFWLDRRRPTCILHFSCSSTSASKPFTYSMKLDTRLSPPFNRVSMSRRNRSKSCREFSKVDTR